MLTYKAEPSSTSDSEIAEYRRTARSWLAQSLERRDGRSRRHHIEYYTPEVMAANRELQRRLFEAGYAGITWPVEYGGQGLSTEHEAAFYQEAADYVLPDFGALGNTTFYTCAPTMLAHASAQFLVSFIPKVLAGQALVCQFFSEPSSGSDLAGIRLRAARQDGGWLLNGQKMWSTFAHLADWGLCLARTNWDVPKHRGLTWFVVPCDSRGLTIRPIRQINQSLEFCEEFFDDVAVPPESVIGKINGGWEVAQTMLLFERGAGRPSESEELAPPGPVAPELVRLAREAGKSGNPVIRQKIAQSHVIDVVEQALKFRTGKRARLQDANPGIPAYPKLFRGTYDPIRARIAVEVGGASAMTWDTTDPDGAERSLAYLDARIGSIAGGTNEMQRNGIGERVLGLPREPATDIEQPFKDVASIRENRRGDQ
jgi:alkylation response protein AidB-like acyl-CoA dehydrogenase